MQPKAFGATLTLIPPVIQIPQRREPGAREVTIEILYRGLDRTDLQATRFGWAGVKFPLWPASSVVGRVLIVGSDIRDFEIGELVGVRGDADSCGHAYDASVMVPEYSDASSANDLEDVPNIISVDSHFVLKIRHAESGQPRVLPLLVAGVKAWSSLRHWQAGPGMRIGIAGGGDLAHIGVKLACAFGASVVAVVSSTSEIEGMVKAGADTVLVWRNAQAMATHKGSFDLILNTMALTTSADVLSVLLKTNGMIAPIGEPARSRQSLPTFAHRLGDHHGAGSVRCEIAELQLMLDFCADHDITADIELIAMCDIEKAFGRMLEGNVKHHFVIHAQTGLRNDQKAALTDGNP